MKVHVCSGLLSTDEHDYTEIALGVYQREDGVIMVLGIDGSQALLITK